MKKAILISVQPKWVAKILNGEKTIEIRKSMPKCDLPIDVYIYVAKSKPFLMVGRNDNKSYLDDGGVGSVYSPSHNYIGNGKVVAKFTLGLFFATIEKVLTNDNKDAIYMLIDQKTRKIYDVNPILKQSCLTYQELEKYGNDKKLYMWHIENLQIFDKPFELRHFYNKRKCNFITEKCFDCQHYYQYYLEGYKKCCSCPIYSIVNKAPQSWQYVYVED